ncbi:hypothetical protein I5Q34_15120 [Streptomyces sp. AV19]|uniref:ATP-binding protein n=1 Tax=Streptomyces sp. AV19 TaxID=2793068 RepID=UPI0018FED735|nr:hypothetical protein [Streptomyces sp. AV19]MBH1935586.1 hypothetical protein [Streptomyces sp. AV19]MDG4534473.1 hypothetical protein [Streptomyces sp. AV19]
MRTAMLDKPRSACSAYRLTAPAIPATTRLARDFVRGILAPDHSPALVEAARICVSDAVTHVVAHATADHLHMDIHLLRPRLLIAVLDDDRTGVFQRHETPPEAKGLMLIRRLSAASGITWKWDPHHRVGSRRVWFELRTSD